MCSVSAVSAYYTETYPGRLNFSPTPYGGIGSLGAPSQTVVHQFDAETKELLKQALQLLDRIDKKLGDVECMDETKKEFLSQLGLDGLGG